MHRTNTPTILRRWLGAAIVSGSAVLTACTDTATAPQAAAVPGGAAAVIVGGGSPPPLAAFVTARLADTTGATLTVGGWVNVITANPLDTVEVLDNDPSTDLDPTPGYIKAKVAKAQSYKACYDFSLNYAGDYWGNTYRACSPEVTSSQQTVHVGVAHGKRKPKVVMLAKNQFGALVGGATYTISTADWATAHTVSEGSAFDRSPVSGNFTYDSFRKPHSDLKVCEVSPPPKHALTSTKCFTIAIKFGGVHTLTFQHEQLIF